MRSHPSSILTTMISMEMIASSTRRPRPRIRAPSVMRSNTLPVRSMMTKTAANVSGTAAATTIPTRQPRLMMLKSNKELQHELIHCFADVYGLIRYFAEADACRQVGGNLLLFGNKGFAEVQTVPTLLHHDAEKQGLLAIMADKKSRGVFVSALHIGNIREL